MRALQSKLSVLLVVVFIISGCATTPPYDYTAYKQSNPRSILILPPVNNSPDVNATYSVFSQLTYPMAESGYYVFPVALVDETFKQNGLSAPADIHAVALDKLREIYGADAALYVTITKYGSTYNVVSSAAVVSANAKLVDLKTGDLLWEGSATASSEEGQSNNNNGLAGLLITAIVKQVANNVTDASHRIAGIASQRLLYARQPNGTLHGPRSPHYVK